MTNTSPILPLPEDDEGAGDTPTVDDDGEQKLDPDAADDLIDSADADRLAVEGEAEPER